MKIIPLAARESWFERNIVAIVVNKIFDNFSSIFYDFGFNLTRCSIAEHTMAKVTFIDPIKSISGKLSKKHHVVHCIRQAATNNPEMIKNPQFTQWKDPNREIKQTAAQMAWTQKFGQICNATRARLIDASHMNADRAAFAQQTEYKTLYSFVWNLVREEI